MTEEVASARAKNRASARDARAARRQVVFEAMAAGLSIEQIAEFREISPRTVRREVDRVLAERRRNSPDRYAHLQAALLTDALRLAVAAIDGGDLKAISPLVKVVRALNRYHGLAALASVGPPALAADAPSARAALQPTHARLRSSNLYPAPTIETR